MCLGIHMLEPEAVGSETTVYRNAVTKAPEHVNRFGDPVQGTPEGPVLKRISTSSEEDQIDTSDKMLDLGFKDKISLGGSAEGAARGKAQVTCQRLQPSKRECHQHN